MKKFFTVGLLMQFVFLTMVSAQISGTVFRDFNNDGTRQNSSGTFVEPGSKGVIINAYNTNNALLASYVSDSTGNYSIPASGSTYNGVKGSKTGSVGSGVPVRLEFVIPTSGSCMSNKLYDYSSYLGTNYGSSVRFVSGNTTGVNFAINNPADYVFDASPFSSTSLLVAGQFVGNPAGGGSARNEPVFFKIPYNSSGTSVPSGTTKMLANAKDVGSIYGVAYSKKAKRIFTSASLKRHTGFGPSNGTFNNAPGTIYMIDPSKDTSNNAATYFISLDALGYPTHNSTGTPAYGITTSYNITSINNNTLLEQDTLKFPSLAAQGVIGTNTQRGLSSSTNGPSNDPAAYGQIGLVSLGDIEVSEDGAYLFVTNLFDRKIYQLQFNNPTNPTTATYVNSWPLPNPPARSTSGLVGASITYSSNSTDFYNGVKGYQRPFGLKYYRGKLYVGAVTTGENGGVSTTENNSGNCEYTDLWGYVWEMTPSVGFNSTPIIQMPLNYFKGIDKEDQDETFQPWTRVTPRRYLYGGSNRETVYAQAMLSDIEFDVDGSMILAIRDRFTDQTGNDNRILRGDERINPVISGDILRAYKNPTTCNWELEKNGKEGISSPKSATSGLGNKEGFGDTANVLMAANVSPGDYAWTNVNAVDVEDNANFTTSAALNGAGKTTQRLQITNMSLDIPTNLTGAIVAVKGIQVRIVRKSSLASSIEDAEIYLIKSGTTTVGTNKATTTSWPTTTGSATYGGSTDLWGTTWSVSEVNASSFGVSIKAKQKANSPIPSIDHVEIIVHYSVTTTNTFSGNTVTVSNYTAYSNGAKAGEFYYEDGNDKYNGTTAGTRWINNNTEGALALMPGTERVVVTAVEAAEETPSSGLSWMNNNNGANTSDYTIKSGSHLGKGGGLGDIELLNNSAPIEIGNRVWNDANGDGIQNAGESGIGNVDLEIYADFDNNGFSEGSLLGRVTTSAVAGKLGEWYFNATNVADGDPFTSGVQAGIQPNKTYIIRLATSISDADWDTTANGGTGGGKSGKALAGYQLTLTNKTGNGEFDFSDNDAYLFRKVPQISVTTGDEGENNHTNDFGFDQLASLGDKVWRDDDLDGIQDAAEVGVAGITVTLYKNGTDGVSGSADDIVMATTITDAYGNYYFDNLTKTDQTNATTTNQTSYNVGFTLPANYQFTTSISSGDNGNNTNSDANVYTGRTVGYNLGSGENDLTADAGIIFTSPASASVGDYVWYDTDNDGVQESGEPGVSNVTVNLLNSAGTTIIGTTITDVNGYYVFNNVIPATYRIGFSLPPGTTFTTKTGAVSLTSNSDAITTAGSTFGKTGTFSVTSGEAVRYVDAGIISQSTTKSSIGDRVWYDNDRDGIQDANELGFAGITVTLRSSVGGPILSTTVTNTYGDYIFNNLAPGNYSINFVKPTGYTITTKNAGGLGYLDSDADVITGNTISYTLIAGEKLMIVDCGLYSNNGSGTVGALGDFVWHDLDGDGIQDAGEPGVAGISVILYNASNTAIDTTSTDKNGAYLFPNLTPASYSVGFGNLPSTYRFTSTDVGTNDAVDSDANPATGKTITAAVTGGATNTSLDAGIIQGKASGLGSLGNRVWYDLPVTVGGTNGNGIQDAGELGVAGISVELLNGSGISIDPDGLGTLTKTTTTTNALGEYMFNGLMAGTYMIQFSNIPAGFTLTSTNTGTDDGLDSDGGALATGGAPAGASRTGVYSLAQGEDNLSIDLGIKPAANTNSLGNYVWFDTDSDGIQDVTEKGVPGIIVTLYNAGGSAIASTTTDKNGLYLFAGLADGTYSVGFTNLLAGFDFTAQSSSNDANGSDADVVSGKTATVVLNSSNRNDRSLDAGLITLRAALGDYVWNDTDKDGIQDLTESGISGVTVTLYNSSGNTALATTITDEKGFYLFPNLNPDTYVVGFGTIPGLNYTIKDASAENLGTDSDPDLLTGKTNIITLSASTINLDIDAGLTTNLPSKIGNYVWSDLDNDGVQDANEKGVGGVLVVLFNSSNQAIGSSITDGNGFWQITNVPEGTGYYLKFTANLPNFDISGTPGSNAGWAKINIGANGTQSLNSGTESDTDSDVTVTGSNAGNTSSFNIVNGNNFQNMDAGIFNSGIYSPLPVSWLKFKATLVNNGLDAMLNWTTATEINNNYFEVERSLDGIHFQTVGMVMSKAKGGHSNVELNYNFLDPNIKNHNRDVIYYRIKQIDFDGKFDHTHVEVITLNNSSTYKAYPNPVKDNLSISLDLPAFGNLITISVTDVNGRVVYQNEYNYSHDREFLEVINLKDLERGYYNLTISDSKAFKVIKIIKN